VIYIITNNYQSAKAFAYSRNWALNSYRIITTETELHGLKFDKSDEFYVVEVPDQEPISPGVFLRLQFEMEKIKSELDLLSDLKENVGAEDDFVI